MTRLLKNLEKYLFEVTGFKVTVEPIDNPGLPPFFIRLYELHQITIGPISHTGIVLKHEDEFKPVQFIKHMRQLPPTETNEVFIVAQSLPTYVRKRLMEKRIPFVIPSVQMYLPNIGLEHRQRPWQNKLFLVTQFSAATQVVLIHCLLGRIQQAITPLELADQLGYSPMTMSRVFDQLEPTTLAHVERKGRHRLLAFTDQKKALWKEARLKMRNPIIQTFNVLKENLNLEHALPAGTTALAHQSMLSEDSYPEYAISRKTRKMIEGEGTEIIPIDEPGICKLQVWKYDPMLLEYNGQVDPFSLYLSFKDTTDERIEMALEQMMEQYAW